MVKRPVSKKTVSRTTVPAILQPLAPLVSLIRRAVTRSFWVHVEERVEGSGPKVRMSSRRDIQRPADGSGPLNHRTYRVDIANSSLTPKELLGAFRRDPNAFSPTSFAEFEPIEGSDKMAVGAKHTVRLPGPWDGPIVVTEADDHSIRLETLEDHLEAGWITFSTRQNGEHLEFVIESLASSGDRVFDFLYHQGRIGRLVQTEMWVRVVEAAVDIAGGEQVGSVRVDTTIYEGADQ